MRYRILHHDERWWPQYRQFLRWKPLEHPYMGGPMCFDTREEAERRIKRLHCNYLNNRRGKGDLDPKIKA